MSKRPREWDLASDESEKIPRVVGLLGVKSWSDFQSIMNVSDNFPCSSEDMFGAQSVFASPAPQGFEVVGVKLLLELLSEPVIWFKETVLHPDNREEPLYLLLYSVLSKLALLSLDQGSLVISSAGPDDPLDDGAAIDAAREAAWDKVYEITGDYESSDHKLAERLFRSPVQPGRSELVVVRVNPGDRISPYECLETNVRSYCKAVMLVEPKCRMVFTDDIWQPMAEATALAILNGKQDPVTVLLTDAKSWYFASVQLVGEIDEEGLPPPTQNEFQACGYRLRLFACKHFTCNLLSESGDRNYACVAKVFAHMHTVLYPGVDISQVAARAERGSGVLKSLADKSPL
ncbi:hypothetical protein VOLCADRAFT_104058 [Volvox carteri f. nagariensis]|uniref:Uncharacterized protein n=1 Tax=Volvox carteri f. nagariensis TaxID=3068 RepID=D8TQY9_VOLCA|nr:uncharacterized protein VOLCADRAFT_104058 [Volvox carteri f. nagariensis]EFJ50109.1 hypothetical protein VOLCADRAFT_104058 [Volvox carteri f. nagariensis]|eukprot:XP_002948729.1 hypothetical protein VOLCADRAFT_104058 [Volvox carteri f. nagariensis]